jgi:hypothetical protein
MLRPPAVERFAYNGIRAGCLCRSSGEAIDVTNFNDRTWFDRAGNFHSDALDGPFIFSLASSRPVRPVRRIPNPCIAP